MSDFTKLIIWQKSHSLTLKIYKLTSRLPSEEKLGLSSQIRRASVSIESNIAEGESRFSTKDKLNFFYSSPLFLRRSSNAITFNFRSIFEPFIRSNYNKIGICTSRKTNK